MCRELLTTIVHIWIGCIELCWIFCIDVVISFSYMLWVRVIYTESSCSCSSFFKFSTCAYKNCFRWVTTIVVVENSGVMQVTHRQRKLDLLPPARSKLVPILIGKEFYIENFICCQVGSSFWSSSRLQEIELAIQLSPAIIGVWNFRYDCSRLLSPALAVAAP